MENLANNSILVIFGATGDLAIHYLFPSLLNLEESGFLPKDLKIVAVSRRDWTTTDYIDFLNKNLTKHKAISKFVKRISFVKAEFENAESFKQLAFYLKDQDDANKHACYNRLFYFAVEPKFFLPLAKLLKASGLLESCQKHNRLTRVLIEKPFGEDYKSAVKLNKVLTSYFSEEQIYRIDHYLGKETVQNLMVARFANVFFEPIWNKQFIDRVEIDVFESEAVGERIDFYNQTGALKDVVQNHLLNILAVLSMEKPKNLSAKAIREAKVKALAALIPETGKTIEKHLALGQYSASSSVKSFMAEGGKVNVETFVALECYLKTPKFKGIPFILRTGKRLSEKKAEVRVVFKKMGEKLFEGQTVKENMLTFRIQPEEKVAVTVNNKIPGFGMDLHLADLDFSYKNYKKNIPGAYERLLLDFIQRDQRLFLESREVLASWKYIDSVVKFKSRVKIKPYMPFVEGESLEFSHLSSKPA